jgi:hypothetical protein
MRGDEHKDEEELSALCRAIWLIGAVVLFFLTLALH